VSGARVTIVFEPNETGEIDTCVYGTTHCEERRTSIHAKREEETITEALAERLPTTENAAADRTK
jgi:hypothetical protein